QSLGSDDTIMRYVACSIMVFDMPPTEYAASRAIELVRSVKEQLRVREMAVHLLARYQRRIQDSFLNGFIASLVRNESLPTSLRVASYKALFFIRDLPLSDETHIRIAEGSFSFADHVDWSFVDTFDE